jgi:hypothetical protein
MSSSSECYTAFVDPPAILGNTFVCQGITEDVPLSHIYILAYCYSELRIKNANFLTTQKQGLEVC